MTVRTPPSAAMASSSGLSSSGMSTRSPSPALTSRTTYALLLYGPIGPILTMRMPPSSKTLTSAPATTHRFGRPLLRRGLGGRFRRRLGAYRRLERALLILVRLALGNRADV